MHRTVSREIALDADDIRRAVWLLLKDVDEPVPDAPDDLQISVVKSERGPAEINVVWETRGMVPARS
jgi:hypothetical protein